MVQKYMKDEIIILSIETVRKSCLFATPGRSICVWRIDRSTNQEFFIREIYSGDKEWIYTKFGDYRHVSKI